METLRGYDPIMQEMIVKFGVKFIECLNEQQQQQIPNNTSKTEVVQQSPSTTQHTNTVIIQKTEITQQQIEQKGTMITTPVYQVIEPSQVIGQQGEDFVERALVSQYPQAVIINTSKIANSGDFLFKFQGKSILIEVKNYASTIPQKEIDKFYNDILITQCDCAIFVSLGQRIANKPRICFETNSQNKQLVFLASQSNADTLLVTVDLLIQANHTQKLNLDSVNQRCRVTRQSLSNFIQQIKKQHSQTKIQMKSLKETLDALLYIDQQLQLEESKLFNQQL